MRPCILVCGGRDFSNWVLLWETLDKICDDRGWITEPASDGNYLPDVRIICGGANGADALAVDWAAVSWCPCERFFAKWLTHGKAAGPIRNKRMIEEGKPDLVVAFPGGRGTANMVAQAKAAGIEVIEAGHVHS